MPYKVAFTGHRSIAEEEVRRAITTYLSQRLGEHPDLIVITGGAIGTDMVAAEAALELGLELWVCLPFHPRIHTARWSEAQRDRLRFIIAHADKVTIVNQEFSLAGYQRRNERMVNVADELCAWFDGHSGGTANCIAYARARKVPCTYLCPRACNVVYPSETDPF
jgi:uncharacterized phage-like protein YoqJ